MEVTRERFPDMLHVGDITKLNGNDLPPVDIITGGSPCQDLSVAGARAGLAGERSGLFMEQVRIVKEMRDADERRGRAAHAVRPRYMVWENVPGAFSSAGGEDFRIVLEEIVRIKARTSAVPRPDSGRWESAGAIILGDQFSLAWRVLDAQYWGVAQRRKRIFLVADFAGRSAPQILFEQDRLFGNPAQSQGERQGTSAAAQESIRDSSGSRAERIDGSEIFAFHINQREETIDLKGVSGALMATTNMQMQTFLAEPMAFAANQRDEVRDLHDVAAALGAQPGMKQQTFVAGIVSKGNGDCFLSPDCHAALTTGGGQAGQGYPCVLTAGFSAGAGASAGSIGYSEELAPTLKGSASGNCMPSVLCLNDQGGQRMDITEDFSTSLCAQMGSHQPLICINDQGGAVIECSYDVSGTLRAQEHGHQPLVIVKEEPGPEAALFENHSIDVRYTGPHKVAPTMYARYGTGGNNLPLIAQEHAVFSRQRVDVFHPDEVVSTQSARQYKDATDLVMEVAGLDCRNGNENGDIFGTLQQGTSGNSLNSIHPVCTGQLIRRLTPMECERLQGFPDGWTDLPGASDSARYKALGNSVAIPCVDFVLQGIAYF